MKRLICFLTIIGIFASVCIYAFADYSQIEEINTKVTVNGKEYIAYAIDSSYDFNTYLSLRSVAEALGESEKRFDFSYHSTVADGDFFSIETGKNYLPVEREVIEYEDEVYLSLYANRLFVDNNERKYYTFRFGQPEDLYMSLTDIQLLFDIGAEISPEKTITLYPDRNFAVDLNGIKDEGYFDQFNSVLIGDQLSGKVQFSTNRYRAFPIASISKIMSYVIVMDAISNGEINESDCVLISENVERISKSEDGRIEMSAGECVPISELMQAMLVASSNEATVALAEHVCGSDEAFTGRMNEKAKELNLSSAVFYNSNGLPNMTIGSIPTKRQNKMSSWDLFRLTKYILDTYPQITEITSRQLITLDTLDYASWNSNSLVFNNSNVIGIKTGNTNASGSCIVAYDKEGRIVIVLGAEDSAMRGRASEILLRSSTE